MLDSLAYLFKDKKMRLMLFLGFASGLPLALITSTLQAYLAIKKVDLTFLAWLALIGQPYAFKFLWAAAIDRWRLPLLLSKRKGWIFGMQIGIALALFVMVYAQKIFSLWLLSSTALIIAFLSATQDLAFDAYRTETLNENERGFGSSLSILGYRIAMLVSGGIAISLGGFLGWEISYLLMASLMLLLAILTLFFVPNNFNSLQLKGSLWLNITSALQDFMGRKSAGWLILLIISYKLSDSFALSLNSAFLIGKINFTPQEVGLLSKTVGFFATLIGISIGGYLIDQLKLYNSLLLFGIFQSITNLFFLWLNSIGHNCYCLALTMAIEQMSSGMGSIALLVLITKLCNIKYTAMQFALLSAIASLGRIYVAPFAGLCVKSFGWNYFFIIATLLGLPSLLILSGLQGVLGEEKADKGIEELI